MTRPPLVRPQGVVPLLVAVLAVAGRPDAARAQPSGVEASAAAGVVTGRVTDVGSGQPVPAAQVGIVGTNRAAVTSADGRFTIRGVPPGTYRLRVLRIGFGEASQQVTVTAGQGATVTFALRAAPVTLAPVVATATGDQRRVEVGNSVASIAAADLTRQRPVANVTDLLTGRTPGVTVLGGATTGAGQRIRIRGASSLSLSNEPIVFIDGMRMTSANNSASIGVGGTNPSRLSDIPPDMIESIEVIKGPSASTLYGTDAANGVIVVRTKRGRVGATRWNAYAERGAIDDRNTYPTAYYGWTTKNATGRASTTSNNVQCFLTQVARGLCAQDSVTTYNLWADPNVSPLNVGQRQLYGINASGGNESAQYFTSGQWEDETGQYRMPSAFADRVRQIRGISSLPRDQEYPNALRRVGLRTNVNVTASPKLDFQLSSGFISSNQRLPQLDNNSGGVQSNAYGGPGFRGNATTGGTALYGFRLYTPDEIFANVTNQAINRFLGSGVGNWRPTSWLSGNLGGGVDFTARNESALCRRDQCTNLGINKTGFKQNNRSEFWNYTFNGSLTATRRFFGESLESRTTAGAQYVRDYFTRNGAYIENLPVGGTTLSQGSSNLNVSEVNTDSKTAGAYLQQYLGWRDVLFGTAAVRSDKNSAFGVNFKNVVYPKFDLSYVISKEGYFPRIGGLDNLRLRGAFGQSGRQPGTTDAVRYFQGQTFADVGGDVPAIVFTALGNANLRPEVTQEIETGFEAAMLGNRLTVDATYYSKTTRNGLLSQVIAPSAGTAATLLGNFARVKNAGAELLVNASLINTRPFGLELAINGARNDNKLVTLGPLPPIVGSERRQVPGYPLNGYWQRRLRSYADANNDGIITLDEIVVDTAASFLGREDPRTTVQFNPTVKLLNAKLRLTANVDRQTGFVRLNGTERIRCQSRNNCLGAVSKTASLFEQARAVAVREHPSQTQAGYMENASFTRLRELAASYDLPERLFRSARASGATVRVGVRNLKVWTKYSGIDPEANYFGTGGLGTISDFQTAPPPTYFTARLDFRF